MAAGHPLDTVRVRLQTGTFMGLRQKGLYACLTATLQHEGLRGLYKGLSPPIVAASFQNAILFHAFMRAESMLTQTGPVNTLGRTYMAGSLAGLACSVVTSPMELVKCRLQVDRTPPSAQAVRACVAHIVASKGLCGLYWGYSLTVLRDVPSYGLFYLTYALGKRAFGDDSLGQLLAGGLAGVTSWTSIYPIDVLKTRAQTAALVSSTAGGLSATWVFCKKIVRLEGWGCLGRGLGTSVLRAFPVNAVTFYVYESVVGGWGVSS